MMRLQEIIEKIEKRYPLEYACDWDNTGLQVGDREQEIETVYVALDATDARTEERRLGKQSNSNCRTVW